MLFLFSFYSCALALCSLLFHSFYFPAKMWKSSYTTVVVGFGIALGLIVGVRKICKTPRLLGTEKSADDYNAAADVLKKLKKELENQRKQLEDELDDAKVQLQENKEQLQLVEMKLTQKDTSEKPEALLMEKQKLLHDQWTLDEKKKNCEREILKREELLELGGAILLE